MPSMGKCRGIRKKKKGVRFTVNTALGLLLSRLQGKQTISPFFEQCRCKFAPFSVWQRLRVGWKHLNADVACARGLMRANPIGNGSYITPGDDGINQSIAAAVGYVRVIKPKAPQIIHIIGQREIPGGVRSRDLSRFGCIGFKYDGLFYRQKPIAAQNLAAARGVFGRNEIRMSAVGSLGRQP